MDDFKLFIHHIEQGNLNEVTNYFQPNFLERIKSDNWKMRPIHLACQNGHLGIVKFLVQNECSIECENKENRRPIHLACGYGHLGVVKFLCECQCDLDCKNEYNETPVEVARRYKRKDCENYLTEILKSRPRNDSNIPVLIERSNGKGDCENYLNENVNSRNEPILKFQKQLAEKKQELEKMKEDIRNMNKRFDERCNELETILKAIVTELDKRVQENTDMKTLETKFNQIQVSQNCGEYLWCIKNWKEVLKQAQGRTKHAIFSDPFYSYKNGYKMCLELILAGDMNGSGPHLSLYVCIMQGQYDNILQWPFQHGVQLELLDKESGKAHVSKIVEYKQQTSHVAWQKPTEKRNTGCGFANFIELSELSFNDGLCRDNEIWIKATFIN